MDQQSTVFVKRGDKVTGPMSWAKAVSLAKQRKLRKADLIGPEPVGPWTAAEAALSEYLKLPVGAVVQIESGTTAKLAGVVQGKVALSSVPADAVSREPAPESTLAL